MMIIDLDNRIIFQLSRPRNYATCNINHILLRESMMLSPVEEILWRKMLFNAESIVMYFLIC